MDAIFLSASVPVPGRGHYFQNADPFLIQTAVRELVVAVINDYRIVWGGHPAITPMIWAICQDLEVNYTEQVVLYQSKFFEDRFPEENERFRNVVYVEAVADDVDLSLARMREEMLGRADLVAAVFVGGMEGVVIEHEMFRRKHASKRVICVASPGGAARDLAEKHGAPTNRLDDVNFASLFRNAFLGANL